MNNMRFVHLTFIAVLLTIMPVRALEATALMQSSAKSPPVNEAAIGIFLSHYPSGTITRLIDRPVRWTDFSPDGKQIMFVTTSDSMYIMDNDGSALRPVFASEGKIDIAPRWTEKGIYWLKKGTLSIIDPQSGGATRIYDLADWADFCVNKLEYRFHSSRDGLRLWFREKMNPKEIPDWNCESTGYGRGIKLYVQFSPDLSNHWRYWQKYWGHGDGMTSDGHLMLVRMGDHHDLGITKQYQDSLDYLYRYSKMDRVLDENNNEEWYVPPIHEKMRIGSPRPSVNNDSIVGAQAKPDECSDCDQGRNYYFFNWRTSQMLGEFALIDSAAKSGLSSPCFWVGSLPEPRDNSPYVRLSTSSVSFSVTGAVDPGAKTVTVYNKGTGRLEKVVTSVSPASDWLTVVVEGDGGDTQTVTFTIAAALLSAGKSEATVTISGGGASNEESLQVQVFKDNVLAPPSGLSIVSSGDSLLDASLRWEDNAEGEAGYLVERRIKGGSWQEVGTTDANATGYIDRHLDYHTQYEYRLKAYAGASLESPWSPVANVLISGIPWIRITSPVAGQVLNVNSVCDITWTANLVNQVYIEYSTDKAKSWTVVTEEGGILEGSRYWLSFPWTTPNEKIDEVLVRVVQYEDADVNAMTGFFAVSPDAATDRRLKADDSVLRIASGKKRLKIDAPRGETVRVELFSASGRLTHGVSGAGSFSIALDELTKGIYLMKCSGAGHISMRTVVVH